MENHQLKFQLDVLTCHKGINVLPGNLLALRYIPAIFNSHLSYFSANFDVNFSEAKAVFRKTEYKVSLTYLYAVWRIIGFTLEICISFLTVAAII